MSSGGSSNASGSRASRGDDSVSLPVSGSGASAQKSVQDARSIKPEGHLPVDEGAPPQTRDGEMPRRLDTHLYFVYGRNMFAKSMLEACPSSQLYGFGALEHHRWIVTEKGCPSIAQIPEEELDEGRPDHRVLGFVWEVTREDFERLDRAEYYPKITGRRTMTVRYLDKAAHPDGYLHPQGKQRVRVYLDRFRTEDSDGSMLDRGTSFCINAAIAELLEAYPAAAPYIQDVLRKHVEPLEPQTHNKEYKFWQSEARIRERILTGTVDAASSMASSRPRSHLKGSQDAAATRLETSFLDNGASNKASGQPSGNISSLATGSWKSDGYSAGTNSASSSHMSDARSSSKAEAKPNANAAPMTSDKGKGKSRSAPVSGISSKKSDYSGDSYGSGSSAGGSSSGVRSSSFSAGSSMSGSDGLSEARSNEKKPSSKGTPKSIGKHSQAASRSTGKKSEHASQNAAETDAQPGLKSRSESSTGGSSAGPGSASESGSNASSPSSRSGSSSGSKGSMASSRTSSSTSSRDDQQSQRPSPGGAGTRGYLDGKVKPYETLVQSFRKQIKSDAEHAKGRVIAVNEKVEKRVQVLQDRTRPVAVAVRGLWGSEEQRAAERKAGDR